MGYDGSYDGKTFRGRNNVPNGEVDSETLFHYRQRGDRLWGTYSGGAIVDGHLLGRVHSDGRLDFLYHHINAAGELMAGTCSSTPRLENGRVILVESWRWFTGDGSSGESEVEEIIGRP